MKNNYVKIQSTRTIHVNPGLTYEDVTNRKSDIPNRMKVNPTWPNMIVQIREGIGWYPAEIVNWNTVKALAADNIITIGEYSDDITDAEVIKKKEELQTELAIQKQRAKKQQKDLESLSEEGE